MSLVANSIAPVRLHNGRAELHCPVFHIARDIYNIIYYYTCIIYNMYYIIIIYAIRILYRFASADSLNRRTHKPSLNEGEFLSPIPVHGYYCTAYIII